ncbi:protein-L-isoaspartate(D-aspartate) O-methyltransferase [Hellea sp.]|nr:protein-L-isoaspartate(D-aspartate) O-methyltransferase [Hellea sp.]MDA8888325.1 protein-L-isoaspartate(D-aspartate) O-methyltransferase [Hellea sp.]MDB4845123.1 protein-L-isoaspartate(D-aspartate) O-methyltransferase [Hellea sp.]MDC0650743.1 protein-L-isoaspartate(D-aspartate) O-methyltransferase [Hellea sp.]MDC1062519.1 protein-L-isoaspartate(D-aspartate) O-methyltransferase [Hellea sp.]
MIDPGLIDLIMRLRGSGISDNNLLGAMETISRKHFVPSDLWDLAYNEQSLPIGCGQDISSPLTIALLTQSLELVSNHKVLEIGSGSGYHTAILSQMANHVYSIERYNTLVKGAEEKLDFLGIQNYTIIYSDGAHGLAKEAPFDRIISTCAFSNTPENLIVQLAPEGRLVAVINNILTIFTQSSTGLETKVLFPLRLPLIEVEKSKFL